MKGFRLNKGVPAFLLLLLLAAATVNARAPKLCVACRGDLGCSGGLDQCAEVLCDDGTWYSCLGTSRMPHQE